MSRARRPGPTYRTGEWIAWRIWLAVCVSLTVGVIVMAISVINTHMPVVVDEHKHPTTGSVDPSRPLPERITNQYRR